MDFLDDEEPSSPTARPVGKFQPKAKARAPPPKKEQSPANPPVAHQAADNQLVASLSNVSLDQTTNLQTPSRADPAVSSMEHLSTISFARMEENAASKDGANQCFHSEETIIASAEVFIELDSVDDFMPQSTTVADPSAECLLNQVESLQASPDFIPDHPSYTDAATACLLSQIEQLLQSSSSFMPDFQSSVDPLNQEGELHGASQLDPSLSEYMPSQSVPLLSGMVKENEEIGLTSSATGANKTGNLSHQRPKQKVATQNVIRSVDEGHDNEGFAAKASDQLNVDDVENNCGDNEEGSKKKKSSSRSKKDANGSDKSVRKRKKTTEASENSNERPLKKFPHSTLRRNRCINKSLLETPEDELDYLRLPIKDLIMLAEYRECQKKEADTQTGQTAIPAEDDTVAAPTERTDNNLWEDPPYDDYDDMYASGRAEGSFDDPSISTLQRDSTYFNYHSHMDKTHRVKWSKRDTELFFEGVQQFGSDLSMIVHLFPGRTRHQIKLKYKKEERQQPMRLLDALTSRAKDHSHYQLVIGRLQEQIDREEEQQRAEEAAYAGAAGNKGSPEKGIAETQAQSQDEASKSEQNDDGLGSFQDPDGAKIGSFAASHDSDVDTYDWSQYKSEF